MAAPDGTRKRPLEVLHLSLPRTGSLSMKVAYEELGLPTYHGFNFMESPADQIQWHKAVAAKFDGEGKPFNKADFDRLLGDYAVLSDLPVLGFTEELIAMYPEAKVVLVERDLEKWYVSFDKGIISAAYTWLVWMMLHFFDHLQRAKPATTVIKVEHAMFRCSDQKAFQANARKVYLEHYASVRRLVPKERILEYRLGSGWEPLCKFLGKPVPDKPFPHLNESKEFEIWMRDTQRRVFKDAVLRVSKYVAIPVVAVGVAWLFAAIQA